MSAASARAAAPPGRLPDFFIIGHPKCGTTALYEMLRGHPQIYMPDVKEPQFFAGDLWRPETKRVRAGPQSLEEYAALFAAARGDQLAGDASTRHIWSPTAAERIAAAQPRARIIAVLREPASFVRSLHLQLLQNGSEDEPSLRRALELEPERRQGRALTDLAADQPQLLQYTERARYLEQLRRYHAVFPSEQVLVLIYEDFRADNEATLREVERFLGVDDSLPFEPVEANPTVRRRVEVDRRLSALAYGRGPLARGLKRAIKLLTPRRLRRDALRGVRRRATLTSPAAQDDELMLELRRRFEPEVRELSSYLGRDLVARWGYDRLD